MEYYKQWQKKYHISDIKVDDLVSSRPENVKLSLFKLYFVG